MIKITNTKFKGLKVIENPKHLDSRGFLREISKEKKIKKKFPFVYISKSKKNVIRGLHYQIKKKQAKIITVIKGSIFDVVVDIRKSSKFYGKHYAIILSEKKNISLSVPGGFAHGFCALEDNTIILYQCSNYRSKIYERGIKWNDRTLNINWPCKKPILSKKDKKNKNF